MVQSQSESLYDYKNRLNWVKKLRWNDAKLRKVPVHSEQTDQQPFISFAEVNPSNMANLYVYKSEVPEDVWAALSNFIANLGQPSGFEQQGMEGTKAWENKKGRNKAA